MILSVIITAFNFDDSKVQYNNSDWNADCGGGRGLIALQQIDN